MITFVAKITTIMKRLLTLLLTTTLALSVSAQTEVTPNQASNLYKDVTKKRVSIHDPSVVYDSISPTKRYYIFGTMRGTAYTTDFQNWTSATLKWMSTTSDNCTQSQAFITPATTKVKKGGADVDFPAFNAMDWSGRGDGSWGLDGNMWAPDVLWNPTMQKWCMYLSINGNAWHSSIVLLTADNILGPYLYQGPVVVSGFDGSSHSYKETDLEIITGERSSLLSRYTGTWATTSKASWPHAIDPCVFYDEEGKLWMSYGSWSGGIWMLELNEETGLRDYDVSYSVATNSDPYFGKRIAGGYYASGEGSYIEYINGYYYLFISNGGLMAGGDPDDFNNGGYQMRVFRSANPDGPYKDAANQTAIVSKYELNFGSGSNTRGVNIFGAYGDWGFVATGDDSERSQGHNSIIAASDGRTYLVYHSRFQNRAEGHQVRVHQVFQNKQGWLVAAPFEYNGEEVTSADIASKELVSAADIPGIYQLLVHRYKLDHRQKELVTPVEITLSADGKVSGAYTGTWSREAGTSYLTIVLGQVTYNGVIIEEQMDGKSIKTVSLSAMADNGVTVWAYKMLPKYELAYTYNKFTMPSLVVKKDIDLYGLDYKGQNTSVQWTSSEPAIISDYGKYNPNGLTANKTVKLTLHLETGDYFLNREYSATAYSENNAKPTGDYKTGLVAHYGFDDADLANTFDATQKAQLLRSGTTALPTLEDGDPMRTEKVLHLNFGANGKESYVSMPNPLYGKTLEKGAAISFWVKRTDDNLWDDLFAFVNGNARFFMTGNVYLGYNDGAGKWLDINQSDSKKTDYLAVGKWQHVTISVSRTDGIRIFINGGTNKTSNVYNGAIDGTNITTKAGFDYNYIVDHLVASPDLFLGKGSFWGSADARFDDVIIYDKPLDYTENTALNAMVSRVFDFGSLVDTGIDEIANSQQPTADGQYYDLQGRRVVGQPHRGIYIINGKKVLVTGGW